MAVAGTALVLAIRFISALGCQAAAAEADRARRIEKQFSIGARSSSPGFGSSRRRRPGNVKQSHRRTSVRKMEDDGYYDSERVVAVDSVPKDRAARDGVCFRYLDCKD